MSAHDSNVPDIRVLDGDVIAEVLSMSDCIAVMESALAELAHGDAEVPVRLVLDAGPGVGAVALMPAELRGSNALGYKVVTVFPGARERGEPAHQAVVALLDSDTGRILAFLDGTSITAIRTAAVSAVATRHLARPDARILTVMGSGVQAEQHLRSIPLVRDLGEIRVWARRPAEAERVAGAHRSLAPLVRAVADPREALAGADIVVTATTAVEPILERAWVAAGCHINAVGACVPTAREIDAGTVADARVFVDERRAALTESGDLLLAIGEGAISPDHIAGELGDVIVGRLRGRTGDDEITLFESLGLGVEDVAAAQFAHRQAVALDLGATMRLRGSA
jgi:alanine dehydrogenase